MEFEQNLNDFNLKPEDYFSQSRAEMLKYINKNPKNILDVGCGKGYFGKLIKEKTKATVWGIEMDDTAGKTAKEFLDNVFIGDVFKVIDTLPQKFFDCIIFNDILEHLEDPYSLLIKVKSNLTEKGTLVCSLPNVRYIGNLKRLLIDKQWKYEDAGILDKTHLRFFTKRSIIDTFKELDYEFIKIEGINPARTKLFHVFNLLSLGNLSDTRFLQFACVVRPIDKK